jgi:predicted small integral membrane protein
MLLEWMAWTWPTALFFTGIALMLLTMTALQLVSPTVERKGLLPIRTTRGDRLFIGLLSAAYIHLAWLGLTDMPLWHGSILALVWLAALMRWG